MQGDDGLAIRCTIFRITDRAAVGQDQDLTIAQHGILFGAPSDCPLGSRPDGGKGNCAIRYP